MLGYGVNFSKTKEMLDNNYDDKNSQSNLYNMRKHISLKVPEKKI